MVTLVNRAKMSTSTTGTGTITLGSAETGYQSFADAGVANGDVIRYVIEDGDAWEIGSGTYTATGTTLTRTVDESSNSDAALNLTGSAVVFITAAGEDIPAQMIKENRTGTYAYTAPSATGDNAIAIGNGATASGTNNATALGYNATASSSTAMALMGTASASQSVSIGYLSSASSGQSMALGLQSSAGATSSTALGRYATTATSAYAMALSRSYASGADSLAAAITNNTSTYGATGANSIAIGQQAKATGIGSVALGYGAPLASGTVSFAAQRGQATGNGSIAMGHFNSYGIPTASGLGAIVIGDGNTGSATRSVVLGNDNTSSHADAVVIGSGASSSAADEITLGHTDQTVRISSSYTLPSSDGTNGQVLTTDGAGAVTFADAGGGGAALYDANESSPTAQPSATGANAIAIGDSATASGADAVAIGDGSTSSSTRSIAIGYNSTSSGITSTALGPSANASGFYGTALGYNARAASGGFNGVVAVGTAYASGADSLAAAIANNTSSYGATGANSVAIGYQAKATSADSIAIGEAAQSTGARAYALGRNAAASGVGSYCIGDDTAASQLYAMAYGKKAKSDVQGKHAFGTFTVENSGDIQSGLHILYVNTTDATATALSTSNSAASSNNQIILPNNSAYAFHGTIVAREQAADGTDCAAWEVKGLIRREGSASTTVLVNSATTVIDNTPSWGLALSADTTNGALKITATGAAATDIRWVATIHTSEVTYA